jgi:tryptophan synthase alpha chain
MPVMGHLVLGYPSMAESLRTAEAYIAAGVAVLELQVPFSHPTADGPVITLACQEAVAREGVRVEDCLVALAELRARHPEQEIVVMSYLNRVFSYGVARFSAALAGLGVRHLIVPDLPVDSGIAAGFGPVLRLVPVLAANVAPERVDKLLGMGFDFFYLMSDFKITGSSFSLNPRLRAVIQRIKAAKPAPRVGIGFGISTPEQARLVATEADLAIIGSALIQARQQGALAQYLAALQGHLA